MLTARMPLITGNVWNLDGTVLCNKYTANVRDISYIGERDGE